MTDRPVAGSLAGQLVVWEKQASFRPGTARHVFLLRWGWVRATATRGRPLSGAMVVIVNLGLGATRSSSGSLVVSLLFTSTHPVSH